MTTAVRSSIARSYSSSGIVRPSGERSHSISTPRLACASQTCPSVGKSSSDITTLFRSAKSSAEAIVDIAIEMFVVIASSSASQPARRANDAFSSRIRGKMSSNHTWSGAPLVAHASRYPSRYRRDRSDTGPRDALIRYALRSSTGNSDRYDPRSRSVVGVLLGPAARAEVGAVGRLEVLGPLVLHEVVQVQRPETLGELAPVRVHEIVQQCERAQDVDLAPVLVAHRGPGLWDRAEQVPQEPDVESSPRQPGRAIVQLRRAQALEGLAIGHGPSLL